MKHILLLLAACLSLQTLGAHTPAGRWLGMLEAGGIKLRLVFNITGTGTALKATMDSPDQGAKDIPVASVQQRGDSLLLAVGPISYKGRFQNDSTIEGIFIQGQSYPMVLRRTEAVALKRPQTPQPPFPYRSEDIVFRSPDSSVTYGATITAPRDGGKHPAVLLISGSGQQNRDGEILEHKPFAVWADYLTRRGFVVMRVDDRGTGKTTGARMDVTTADFAADAGYALDLLKARPEVDPGRLGIVGHSEGGMIATLLGASRNDLKAIVSMAGPGMPNKELLILQNDALLEKGGAGAEARKAYRTLYTRILHTAEQHTNATLNRAIEQTVQDWKAATPADLVRESSGISDSATEQAFVRSFNRQLVLPWFRYFAAYDPQPHIRKIRAHVLAINGSADIQVVSGANLAGWKAALKSGRAASYEVKELPGLNHLFQTCGRCDTGEYGQLEETVAPAALKYTGDWLERVMK